jgi:hypothetical protein
MADLSQIELDHAMARDILNDNAEACEKRGNIFGYRKLKSAAGQLSGELFRTAMDYCADPDPEAEEDLPF